MKYKKINSENANHICDKLTRFKPAKIRYKKLFDEVLVKYMSDNHTPPDDELERAKIAVDIINSSFSADDYDPIILNILKELEHKTFKTDELSLDYLSFRINLCSIINNTDISDDTPKNVIWLKKLVENKTLNLAELRNKYSLLYPLEGIILCEGQTEYTLLEEIFSLYDINLSKKGLMVIPAGGKNQVARKYYELIEYLKLPIYILLDNDATEIKELIDTKLRKIDKLYLIKSGEFEDIIPIKILMNTINSIHNNDYNCNISDFSPEKTMVENLELIYKKYGYGEFKKAQFAKELNDYIVKYCSKDDFSGAETENIIKEFFS